MYYIGVMYEQGRGSAIDYDKAREWYERAADKGSGAAQTDLGYLYEFGQGVEPDMAKARALYEKGGRAGVCPGAVYIWA